MAKKISELTAITTIADDDLTPIVDTSETETKKMTASQMKTYAQGDLNTRLTTVETNGIIGATQYGGTIVTNLNTISKGGFYTALGTATGVPTPAYSWFITHQNSNTGTLSATQRVVAFSTNLIIYERTKISGTWGSWVNRSTINNLTTASAGNGLLDAYQGKVLNDKITNLKTYSTSEIDTGEIWIDGKHIYRTVATGTFASDLNFHTVATNVSTFIDVGGTAQNRPFTYFLTTENNVGTVDIVNVSGALNFRLRSTDVLGNQVFSLILRYTKTS